MVDPSLHAAPTLAASAYAALPARELVKLVQLARAAPHHRETQLIFTAFYDRYVRYLTTVVARQIGPLADPTGLREVVHDVYLAFFQSSGRFDADLAPNDEACDRNLRAYLAALANWRAKDARIFQRSFGASAIDATPLDEHTSPTGTAAVVRNADCDTAPPDAGEVQRVAEWLAALPAREADILRTYYVDDHMGRKSDRLPEGVARQLAMKYATTTSNIRHLKQKLLRDMRGKFPRP